MYNNKDGPEDGGYGNYSLNFEVSNITVDKVKISLKQMTELIRRR